MHIVHEIVLKGRPEEVWEFFDNPENLKKWHPNLVSFSHVQGDAGQPGAISRLVYQEGKRSIQLTEVIDVREKPSEFTATYTTADGSVSNRVANLFSKKGTGTLWVVEADFEFSGLLMRFMSRFLENSMHKRTLEDMQRFKAVFESRPKPKKEKAPKKPKKKTKKAKKKTSKK